MDAQSAMIIERGLVAIASAIQRLTKAIEESNKPKETHIYTHDCPGFKSETRNRSVGNT